jgi:hypothetical protein
VTVRRLAFPLAVATLTLVVLLALRPISTSRALAGWTLLLAALALIETARSARTQRRPSRFETALRRKPGAASLPAELVRLQRRLELGAANADFAHRRLLPLLRATAAARLSARHGVDLARQPGRAQELLGQEAWNLLRPDRPAPEDRHGPGVPLHRIAATIERVEAL